MRKITIETIVGIFVLIGIISISYMTVKLGNVNLLKSDSYKLYAKFTSVSGLRINNNIEIFGMEVGRVKGLIMDQEKQLVVVEMQIANGIKIYEDAIASIKTSGLIGERYININPGGAYERLLPGATIIDTEPPIDLTDIISKYAFGDISK